MLFEKNSSILELDSIQKVECRLCGSGRTKHWGEFTEDDREPSFSNPSANLVDIGRIPYGQFFAHIVFYKPSVCIQAVFLYCPNADKKKKRAW